METRKSKAKSPQIFEDEPILQKNSCSLWAVFIILILIFLTVLALLLYTKIKNLGFSTKTKTETSETANTNDLQKDLSNKITGESIVLTIKEGDLDSAIKSAKDFPLKNPSLKILSSKILIAGKTSNNILGFNVEVGITPKVLDGALAYDITEIKTAGVNAPKKISDQVNKSMSSYLTNLIPSTSSVVVSEVKLFDTYLEVIGTKK